jgi:phenylacetic acid degradation protein
MIVPPRMLAAGVPAKIVRPLTAQEMNWKSEGTGVYQALTRRCHASMIETEALTEAEANRPRIVMPEVIPLVETKAGQKP